MSTDKFLRDLVQEQGREILHKRGSVLGFMADLYPADKRGLRLKKKPMKQAFLKTYCEMVVILWGQIKSKQFALHLGTIQPQNIKILKKLLSGDFFV